MNTSIRAELKSDSGDGSITISVRANHAARLYYLQEFNGQLDKDLEGLLKPGTKIFDKLKSRGITLTELLEIFDKYEQAELAASEKKQDVTNDDTESKQGETYDEIEVLMKSLKEKGLNLEELLEIGSELTEANNRPRLDAFAAMPILWAMAKADAYANKNMVGFEANYEKWLLERAEFDVNDCAEDFEQVCRNGFFRDFQRGKRKKK